MNLRNILPELLENMIPWDARELEKRTKDPKMHPKRTLESFQDQRCNQIYPEKVSRRGPWAPEAPQKPTNAEKYQIPIIKLMCLRKIIKFL